MRSGMTMPSAAAKVRPEQESAPLLSLRNVNKSFGAVHVLQDVDFDAHLGQVTALVGDNGAGKSTLIKGIAGIHAFDSGDYQFEGHPVTVHNPKQANDLGIEVVYQDLALCDNLDIVHNLFLGRELTRRRVLDEATMERRATETLAGLSVRTVRSIRDEPTAALGVAQTEQVLKLVRRLADRGLAVVLISHNLNDVFEVADNIAVLYLGRMAAQVTAREVTSNQVVELITAGRSGSIGLAPGAEPEDVIAEQAEIVGVPSTEDRSREEQP